MDLCPRLSSYAAPGAMLLLSGILVDQAPEVRVMLATSVTFSHFSISADNITLLFYCFLVSLDLSHLCTSLFFSLPSHLPSLEGD